MKNETSINHCTDNYAKRVLYATFYFYSFLKNKCKKHL